MQNPTRRAAPIRVPVLALVILLVSAAGLSSCATAFFYDQAVARKAKPFLGDSKDLASTEFSKGMKRAYEWCEATPGEIVAITSGDGLKLAARYFPAPASAPGGATGAGEAAAPKRRIAILAHGYSSEGAAMGGFGRYYRDELGFSVLMPDARGHGASEGDYIGFGWHERLDYLRWIDWVVAREGPDCEIILHGISMGGATVLMTSGEELPPQVRAIVSDCAYTSAYEELAHQLKSMYRLGDKPFLPATSRLTKKRAGYSFEEASALEQVKKAKLPILFIHGGADTFVPTEMVHRLAEACPTEKEIFIVPNAGHGLAWTADPAGYRRTLKAFLDKWS